MKPKPQPLLYLRPVEPHERSIVDDSPDVCVHGYAKPCFVCQHAEWKRTQDDWPNYDGQGKSRQQESDDSLRMLGVSMLIGVAVGIGILVLAAWLVLR